MAKKKRTSSSGRVAPAGAVSHAASPALPPFTPTGMAEGEESTRLPVEAAQGGWTVILLALMMFLAPALGSTTEEMLQDTLKSIVVSFAALGAGLLFFWHQRHQRGGLRWHALMWLPLGLMAYALGSMVWSHTYLGGVEAIRWFIFSLLLWLGLNTLSRERLPTLAWGIHWGACLAALWTALQFWIDFRYFPQGPNPASTFVNRNFLAEFVVCTLPFSVLLITQARASAQIALLAGTTGFNLVAIMMTGTRSALLALLAMVLILPFILFRYRRQLVCMQWSNARRFLLPVVFLGTVLGLGLIPSGNAKLLEENRLEQRGVHALERAFSRSLSMTQAQEYTERSFSIRLVMWQATARIIQARPLTGVGAGAWEVDIPLYQSEGSQLETDYYAHNEILQLLAEYGLVGWLFLLGLLAYLTVAAWRTVRNHSPQGLAEAPLRAFTLLCLLMFLIVSNAGFPWRMASTGAIFALALAVLAASDARLGYRGLAGAGRLAWQPAWSKGAALALLAGLALAAYITQQAAAAESKIVRAVKIALTISQSGNYNSPQWDNGKREMLRLIREGIEINPHYRKITPMVADELARWGDWKNAVWIWESVLDSRPYIVAIMSNVARGYAQMGQNDKALEYLDRAKKLQPKATTVNSLEVILLSRTGREPEAYQKARALVAAGVVDIDLLNATSILAVRAKDWPMAVRALELRNQNLPAYAVDGWLKMGNIYAAATGFKDETKALAAYREALALAPDAQKAAVRAQIPAAYWPRL